ncbi:hypothetical protein [Novosphingobium album (ex Hu et al. 2023)]|uniref:Polysaccharide biosynthesis protein n=1 Tax=Novosphingobium album (ex Hu et al. 2023) TaxID=2930093 RepID=A0ABT0B5U4_9SPHN|nr:hypothetical protein [Novosphingobium album (ex Hu et al. 2023)]MCJ2180440.1 hypothetical protein [Novosphingobium album (ex Hu et al. 2023)]
MSRQFVVIIAARFAPVVLAVGLTAALGLEIYGVLRLYLAEASLAVGIVFAGFVPAYVARQHQSAGTSVRGAWLYLCLATVIAASVVLLVGNTSSVFAAVGMVLAVTLMNAVESQAIFQRKPVNSAATALFGMTVLNLSYWIANLVWSGKPDTSVIAATTLSIISLTCYHIFWLSNRSAALVDKHSHDGIRSAVVAIHEVWGWVRWQGEYMAGAAALAFYVNLVPVLLGRLYGPEAVALATLSISVGTLFSFVPTRFLLINLSSLRSGGKDQPFGLRPDILRNLARVRLLSVIGGAVVLIGALTFSGMFGIDPAMRWSAFGYLVYPLASTFVGPCSTVLTQIGGAALTRRNALVGCGGFLAMVGLVAVFLPQSQMAFGLCYLFGRVGNDLLDAISMRKFSGGAVSLSIWEGIGND